MLLSILAGADKVVVFMEACEENTCLGLNKDENT
jgi:signal transduction protein with GAF and PtsI domain